MLSSHLLLPCIQRNRRSAEHILQFPPDPGNLQNSCLLYSVDEYNNLKMLETAT